MRNYTPPNIREMSLLGCSRKRNIGARKCFKTFCAFIFGFAFISVIELYAHFPTADVKVLQGTDNLFLSSSYWDALLDSKSLTGNQLLHYVMWTNSSSCQLSHDFGGVLYLNPSGIEGQKAVCIDAQVARRWWGR